jgi:5-methylcytosine-specific restriction enzyme A
MSKIPTLRPMFVTLDTRVAKPPSKQVDPFYQTPEWREFAARILNERGRYCEDPLCTDRDCSNRRIYPDHIKELKDGGAPLDPANILLRCPSCHTRKTIEERAKRTADTV